MHIVAAIAAWVLFVCGILMTVGIWLSLSKEDDVKNGAIALGFLFFAAAWVATQLPT